MANRSYLYSTNVIPGPNAKTNGRKLIGISEWNYGIPIVYKLLLSGNPKTCQSSIWDNPEKIALIGDYTSGVKNLEGFLSKVALPSAQELITEAIEFLNNPENQNQYFVLECGEIFDMGNTPILEQNLELFEQVQNLHPEMVEALQSLLPPPVEPPIPVGFFSKLFGLASEPQKPVHDPMKSIYALGLGNWSNILYFDFTNK
ncbi:MAG: hypothetical protein B7Y56_01035 [Gallionellales bacterium 35-53-114]|nr:MAG: hypothetical protein B7Y56_01035 [Gallionellales bacterium 35-53-114]OYZ64220.1 MAG: hypothetical protein B7Y04_04820 [Gallionellales bacterium 24-53-125]OZB10470.1 MAG: hypothetical protein B7X61_02885 [Gallionellales bacterium 39-52-133]HQS57088.1 hypothetical protein [Gallionellaceae bacterium]HQS74724.1 hypothetical protein [Gallionellaceae bacterium]